MGSAFQDTLKGIISAAKQKSGAVLIDMDGVIEEYMLQQKDDPIPIVSGSDCVFLRKEVESRFRDADTDGPFFVTLWKNKAAELPFDWMTKYYSRYIGMEDVFPGLDEDLLKQLDPTCYPAIFQVINRVPDTSSCLNREQTIQFLFRALWGIDILQVPSAERIIGFLLEIHTAAIPLPVEFEVVLENMSGSLDIAEDISRNLIKEKEFFIAWLRKQLKEYIQTILTDAKRQGLDFSQDDLKLKLIHAHTSGLPLFPDLDASALKLLLNRGDDMRWLALVYGTSPEPAQNINPDIQKET